MSFLQIYRRLSQGNEWQTVTGCDLSYANKKYCGHRVIPKTISKDLDDDNIHKYKVSTIFLHYNQFNSSISLKSLDAAWACRACHMHVTCTWCSRIVQEPYLNKIIKGETIADPSDPLPTIDDPPLILDAPKPSFADSHSHLVFKGPVRSGFWAPGRLTETETGCLFRKSKNNRTETGNNWKIGY